MAGVKISELPAATTPLAGTELLAVVQGGVTKQASADAVSDTVLAEFAASDGSSLVGFLRATGFGGITLPPLGIFILAERINEAPLIRHEQVHWQQAQRMGVLRWYVTYVWNNLRYGYRNNPLEVEARAAEVL